MKQMGLWKQILALHGRTPSREIYRANGGRAIYTNFSALKSMTSSSRDDRRSNYKVHLKAKEINKKSSTHSQFAHQKQIKKFNAPPRWCTVCVPGRFAARMSVHNQCTTTATTTATTKLFFHRALNNNTVKTMTLVGNANKKKDL